MLIRDYQSDDAKAVTDIFYETIHEVATEYYTHAQVNAWAPLPVNYSYWEKRLSELPPFVAVIDTKIVGFISLTESGHIEWAFTHKEYQRKGVASALYAYLEQRARSRQLVRLTVDASRFARPFFEKHGFNILRQNDTEKDGEILINWTMEQYLADV